MDQGVPAVEFCGDGELGYERSRTRFAAGSGLRLDEGYRLAHLPLVAPAHPDVIPQREGKSYRMGRHERVFSLVLPIPPAALGRSDAYQGLRRELETSPFAQKIAWDLLPRRQDKLHATVCGSLGVETAPVIADDVRRALAALGPVTVELRGLFSGNVNVGRLYVRAYPEKRGGVNAFHRIQRILGRPETDLYVVGIYNLVDHLDAAEASALDELVRRWWSRPILRFEADQLWLLGATDDLVLDSVIADRIALS